MSRHAPSQLAPLVLGAMESAGLAIAGASSEPAAPAPATLTEYRNWVLEPFQLSDLDACPWVSAEGREAVALLASNGHGAIFTGRYGKRIVSLAGITTMCPGVGELWSFLAPEARRHPVALCRHALRGLAAFIDQGQYRRLHAFAREDRPAHRAFLEWLGFRLESRHPLLGSDGCTMRLYVLFPDGAMSQPSHKAIVV